MQSHRGAESKHVAIRYPVPSDEELRGAVLDVVSGKHAILFGRAYDVLQSGSRDALAEEMSRPIREVLGRLNEGG